MIALKLLNSNLSTCKLWFCSTTITTAITTTSSKEYQEE